MLSCSRLPLSSENIKIHSLSFGNALESALRLAEYSIFISAFVLGFGGAGSASQTRRIVDLLIYKYKHCRIDIRLALSYHSGRSRLGARSVHGFYYLSAHGIPFRFPALRRSLHAKMCIIDAKKVFIGSHNLFDFSFNNPMELTAEIDSIDLGRKAADDFLTWWPCLVEAPFVDGVSWQS